MRARYEELEKHNETLKAELEKASQDKEDLKETHKITWSRFKHSSIKRRLKHQELKSHGGNFGKKQLYKHHKYIIYVETI